MKKQAILLIAVSLFLLVVAGAGIASTDHLSAQSVAPRDFKRLLDRHHDSSDLVLLDVRTPREFAAGHIQGAVLMDVYARDLAERLDTLDRNKT